MIQNKRYSKNPWHVSKSFLLCLFDTLFLLRFIFNVMACCALANVAFILELRHCLSSICFYCLTEVAKSIVSSQTNFHCYSVLFIPLLNLWLPQELIEKSYYCFWRNHGVDTKKVPNEDPLHHQMTQVETRVF